MAIRNKQITLMLTTAAKGGMNTVVQSYFDNDFIEKHNTIVIKTHTDNYLRRVIYLFSGFIQFLYYLSFYDVRLIHIHTASRGSFWRKSIFFYIGLAFNRKIILHLHGASFKEFYVGVPNLLQKYISSVFNKASTVVVLSNSWKNYISSICNNQNIIVVPNFVNVPKISTKKADVEKVRILFLGIIGERKGIYDLIDSFDRLLTDTNVEAELLVGGNGEIDKLSKLVSSKGLKDKVKILGWVSDKRHLLETADIYVLPSYNEGLPMSILEAMSWSIPIISTDVGGIPELVRDQVDGFIITPGDREQLYNTLKVLTSDVEVRVRMGNSSRCRIVESYSDSSVLPVLDEIYEEAFR